MEKTNKTLKLKNYLLLVAIFAVAIAITLYLCSVYNVYEESKRQIPVIRDTLFEISSVELEHYISENPIAMIYMCTASDSTCRTYEKDLKKLVKKEGLQDTLIYLNITEEEQETFPTDFNAKYSPRLKLTSSYPALVIFEEGQVTHLLQAQKSEKLTMTKTKQFMDLHKIGE